jgi:rhodanese-related sulfurtransferase
MSMSVSGRWRGGSVGGRHAEFPDTLYHSGHMSLIAQVEAADWESWFKDNDATVLDVREPGEWQQGTLPEAVLMSQGDVVDRLAELPKDKPVLCVCRSGGRSSNVAAFLAFNGYEAANLAGGMKSLGMQD